MAVKIRLARRGRKNYPVYNIVVADSRSPRDGKFIKNLGLYNPNTKMHTVQIDEDCAIKYLLDGAQPTATVRDIFSKKGILMKKHLLMGVKKGDLKQEEADKKYIDWLNKFGTKYDRLEQIASKITDKSIAAKKETKVKVEDKAEEKNIEIKKNTSESSKKVAEVKNNEASKEETEKKEDDVSIVSKEESNKDEIKEEIKNSDKKKKSK